MTENLLSVTDYDTNRMLLVVDLPYDLNVSKGEIFKILHTDTQELITGTIKEVTNIVLLRANKIISKHIVIYISAIE